MEKCRGNKIQEKFKNSTWAAIFLCPARDEKPDTAQIVNKSAKCHKAEADITE